MIVNCHSCGKQFKLDDSKVSPEGTWVRCSACKEVFQVYPEGVSPPPEPPLEAAPQPTPAPEPPAASEAQAELGLPPLDESPPVDLRGEGPMGPSPGSPGEDGPTLAELGLSEDLAEPTGKGRGMFFKVFFWLLGCTVIAALVILGVAGALRHLGVESELVSYLQKIPGANRALGLFGPPPSRRPQAAPQRLYLKGVKSYYHNNGIAGRLFVIEGVVENQGQLPRSAIVVQGVLRDSQGREVLKQMVYAGKNFTLAELGSMPLIRMREELARPAGMGDKAKVLAPGMRMPFMIIFAKLPPDLKEYEAKVLDSKPAGGRRP